MKKILFIDYQKYSDLYDLILQRIKEKYEISFETITSYEILNTYKANLRIHKIDNCNLCICFNIMNEVYQIIKLYNKNVIQNLKYIDEIITEIDENLDIKIKHIKNYNKRKRVIHKKIPKIIEPKVVIKNTKKVLIIDYDKYKSQCNDILQKLTNIDCEYISSNNLLQMHNSGKYIPIINRAWLIISFNENIKYIFEIYNKQINIIPIDNVIKNNDIIIKKKIFRSEKTKKLLQRKMEKLKSINI